MGDLFDKFQPLIDQREALLSTGMTDPFNLVMEEVVSPTVAICSGRKTILLGTYNYMGMTFDPDVIAAGKQALDDFGSGTTGSRVLNGTYSGHKACEEALKDFYDVDHAMVFSTGYQANLGIISTIAGKEDYIILDIDSHASIYDGCAMGNANIVPFRHNDLDALEKRLKRIPEGAGKLVVLEGVYSMLGDIAPLDKMVPLAKKYGAMVLVDEAHSMGFIGEHGRGVAEAQGVIDDCRLHHRHLLEVGRHGRRFLRLQPSQVRDHALGVPTLCLYRIAPAQRGCDRRDVDPQAEAQRRQARPSVGKFQEAARRAQSARLPARHRRTAIGDHRGDHARSGERRRNVGSASSRRALRQSGPSPGDASQHDAAALFVVRRTFV